MLDFFSVSLYDITVNKKEDRHEFKRMELHHSIELEISIGDNKTAILTTLEQVVASSALLAPLLLNNKLIGFPPNCIVNLIYTADDKVYIWRNVTVKAVKYTNKIYHSAELVGDAETLNRRGAYRVFIGEEMDISIFTNSGPAPMNVFVKDISETGFAFLTPEELDTGRALRLNLKLQNGSILKLSAKTVRKQSLEDRAEFLYGCKFSERNSLLASYLMKLQQQRQKEKLEGFSALA